MPNKKTCLKIIAKREHTDAETIYVINRKAMGYDI